MHKWAEVKPLLEKVLMALHEDRNKFTHSVSDGGLSGGRITAWRLEQAADNHLFDDHPDRFRISKNEGHILRNYFLSHWKEREYIELLHKEFPQYMDKENSRYISDLNKERARQGLLELQL